MSETKFRRTGSILLEVNCRVMGGSAPVGFLDKVFGYHETDVILDSMLDRDYHREFLKKPYRPLRKGYVKDFHSDRERRISSSGIIPILLSLRSFYTGRVENAGTSSTLQETKDFETEAGCAYLVHDDPEVTGREYELLSFIEENYPELLYSDVPLLLPPDDESLLTPEVKEVLERDPETLILDIITYYRNGEKGKPVVPEELIEARHYNRDIMDLLKKISGIQ